LLALSPLLLTWLIAGFLVVVACHELTHVLIARAHGHRLVCVALNPVGAAVVIEDQPTSRYWCWQVLLPLLVTAASSYLWLLGLVALPLSDARSALPADIYSLLPWQALLLAVLTSLGDLLAWSLERRRPRSSGERVVRDLELLRKLPSVVRFTSYGRRRWGATWGQLASRPTSARIADPGQPEASRPTV
jgi:hypothetical protein